ncbi:site-specific integrase [Methyloterricola oryzae]|uniref:site-specific integrase n=1 Tax=Methyloterricola oryzae TaxID=1495050 RepID=UPI0034DD1886
MFCDSEGNRIQSIKRSFGTVCSRAGIEDFHIHDLRRACAAWLVQAGVPLIQVRDLLRHSTVEMTERYAHLSPDNVRTAVAALNGLSRSGHATFG